MARKNSLLTGRNLEQDLAQEELSSCESAECWLATHVMLVVEQLAVSRWQWSRLAGPIAKWLAV